MKLVFVHGMRQEGKDPVALRREWEGALFGTWIRLGLEKIEVEVEMPFYGDVLDELTLQSRGEPADVVARGDTAANVSPLEQALLSEMASKAGISDSEIEEELGGEVVARGPMNWEWVQATGRVLERRLPMFRSVGLRFVHQVDAYLTRPHIRAAVDQIVSPALNGENDVIVSHSLGTVVSYTILRKYSGSLSHPLFVTLGSPLGINTVKGYLKPPSLAIPSSVKCWLNGTDNRDYVALYASLDQTTFVTGIDNVVDIQNRREDAHLITDYLSNDIVASRIHFALSQA
ncbi:hypothetical protein [Rhizobium azibense]|uniref:Uncharacterized protein n=1 Tax=Rhizobium azibense TaxID=1136135 RepID=A0A4R3RBU4_9HYPH|nr:hypothetical protein [Rhizobium azibense]TCU32893.1 hypothetical protein EV129_118115 [Rhizobium azibense]